MKKLVLALLLAATALLGAACALPAAIAPGPNDLGCGAYPVECGGGLCCEEGHVCGGQLPGCPWKGECCWRGGDGLFSRHAAHRSTVLR